MRKLAFTSIGIFLSSFLIHAQIIVTDEFDSNTVDTSKWQIILPFNNQFVIDRQVTSAATQNYGILTLTGGASINSKANIGGSYKVSGIFNQTSPGGRTIITLRGDGVSSDPAYGNPNGSILFFFYGDPNANGGDPNYKCDIGIASSAYAWDFNINEIYRDNNFQLQKDNPTSFSITDWGNLLEVNINDKLVSRIDLSPGGFGTSVTIASQWVDNSGLQIDSLRIESIPEPSAISLLAIGLGGWVIVRRRR